MSVNNKRALRARVLTLLRNQEDSERKQKSGIIAEKLYAVTAFRKAAQILFYASFDGEVDTIPMIKKAEQLGKRIGLPKLRKQGSQMWPMLLNCNIDDCLSGAYGIKEPSSEQAENMDCSLKNTLIIVPGVAFDKKNNRLGRGMGFYDRFLSQLPSSTPMIGLAFDFQIFDEFFFVEPHDVCLSDVIFN